MEAQSPISSRVTAGSRALFLFAAVVAGILRVLPTAAAQNPAQAELTTQEAQPAFKIQVERNLVLVRAVVRDSKGRAVGNLRKEDFRLFDNGKPQTITQFAVEIPSSKQTTRGAQQPVDTEALPETALAPSTAQRFLAMYFDDVHLDFPDLARSREAAERYLASALQAGDRIAVFTSSGQIVLDFTDDRSRLHEAFSRILPRPILAQQPNACPDLSPYQAYLINFLREASATEASNAEVRACHPEMTDDQVRMITEAEAAQVMGVFQMATQYALHGLEQLVRRMAAVPGQRNIVLVSPGFLTLTQEPRVAEIVERALRSNVFISTLDAKGLFAEPPLGDASKRPLILEGRTDIAMRKSQWQRDHWDRAATVLERLAADTGGEYFHNSNDLEEGFRKAGALPEAYYVLAFTPQNLKLDGRFHTLKVTLGNSAGLTVLARRGYFAPKKPLDTSAQAKEEIEQAAFSQDELQEIPIDVHTEFVRVNEAEAKLYVLTHVDLRFVRFRKDEGRNLNKLTFVTMLFDRDGKYVTGKQKLVDFRLRDTTLEELSRTGVTLRTGFDVRPGNYLVRQVLRDAEGGQLSAMNRSVEIPF